MVLVLPDVLAPVPIPAGGTGSVFSAGTSMLLNGL